MGAEPQHSGAKLPEAGIAPQQAQCGMLKAESGLAMGCESAGGQGSGGDAPASSLAGGAALREAAPPAGPARKPRLSPKAKAAPAHAAAAAASASPGQPQRQPRRASEGGAGAARPCSCVRARRDTVPATGAARAEARAALWHGAGGAGPCRLRQNSWPRCRSSAKPSPSLPPAAALHLPKRQPGRSAQDGDVGQRGCGTAPCEDRATVQRQSRQQRGPAAFAPAPRARAADGAVGGPEAQAPAEAEGLAPPMVATDSAASSAASSRAAAGSEDPGGSPAEAGHGEAASSSAPAEAARSAAVAQLRGDGHRAGPTTAAPALPSDAPGPAGSGSMRTSVAKILHTRRELCEDCPEEVADSVLAELVDGFLRCSCEQSRKHMPDVQTLQAKLREEDRLRNLQWLVQACCTMNFSDSVLFATVHTFDRFYAKCGHRVPQEDSPRILLGIICIALKNNAGQDSLSNAPLHEQLAHLCHKQMSFRDVVRTEFQVLSALEFETTVPLPLEFLDTLSVPLTSPAEDPDCSPPRCLASFLLHLALFRLTLLYRYPHCILAAASIYVALCNFDAPVTTFQALLEDVAFACPELRSSSHLVVDCARHLHTAWCEFAITRGYSVPSVLGKFCGRKIHETALLTPPPLTALARPVATLAATFGHCDSTGQGGGGPPESNAAAASPGAAAAAPATAAGASERLQAATSP